MSVTAVIPTLNAGKNFSLLLKKLHVDEIVVIDSGSTDNTLEVAGSYGCKIIKIGNNEFNHATTRNIALNFESDFYLFLTQDVNLSDTNVVKKILRNFEDKDVVLAYARQLPYEDADVLERFSRFTNYPESSATKSLDNLSEFGIKTFFSSNCFAVYRGEYFRKVRGFKDGLVTNEDMEFAARAILNGKKVVYDAETTVFHSHKYSYKELFKRYYNIGVFFKKNRWILEEVKKYKSLESSGISNAIEEIKYVLKHEPKYLGKSVFFSGIKYFGYKIGVYNPLSPKFTKK